MDDAAVVAHLCGLEVLGGPRWHDMPAGGLRRALAAQGLRVGEDRIKRLKREAVAACGAAATRSASPPPASPTPGVEGANNVGLGALRAHLEARGQLLPPGLLATLAALQKEWALEATMRQWTAQGARAAGGVAPLCSPTFKRRSVDTAMRHAAQLERMPQGWAPGCVLYGDSMFERMVTKFRGRFAAALGHPQSAFIHAVGGDGVEHLRCRLCMTHDALFAGAAEYVVMIGVNNLLGGRRAHGVEAEGEQRDPVEVAAAIAGLVADINASAPSAQVFVCHVLHVFGSGELDPGPINARVDALNACLDSLLKCRTVHTRIPHTRQHYDSDGLHLSSSGYACLVAQLQEAVPTLQAQPLQAREPAASAALLAGLGGAAPPHDRTAEGRGQGGYAGGGRRAKGRKGGAKSGNIVSPKRLVQQHSAT